MSRCSICDYLEGYGSTFSNQHPDGRRVQFRKEMSDFVCDPCYNEVIDTIAEMEPETFTVKELDVIEPSKE